MHPDDSTSTEHLHRIASTQTTLSEDLTMNRFNISKRTTGSRKQRGQGMTEYIIIVALIAIAAIGVYSAFGRTVQAQVSAVANGLAGQGGQANAQIQQAAQRAQRATQDANTTLGLNNYTANDQAQ